MTGWRASLAILASLLVGIVLAACASTQADPPGSPTLAASSGTPQVGPDGHFPAVQVAGDGTRHLIPLHEIRAGGPPKDGIPSIDAPLFSGPDGWAALNYRGDGLVIGVEVNGKRRAYPFQILIWHEIANDRFDGQPLLVTYCPLCGTGIVFIPVVEDQPVEFGVSGKLYNSDLLMYDRATDSLWSQITGTAVVGERSGTRLELYPSEIMTWDEWRTTYPDSEVLTRQTGHSRDYDATPYRGYDTNEEIWFPVGERDDRLHPKTLVTGVELDSATFGAYPDEQVIAAGPVNDTLGDTPLLIVADVTAGNTIRVFERRLNDRTLTFRLAPDSDALIDDKTGSRWTFTGLATDGELIGSQLAERIPVRGFWFAWFAFHPDTALWLPQPSGS
ncbi:MAG: DUF3179 domain-containing protein [Chloroflexota bacterium]|nr:DUF3179 domain-containing protein [Chloroflexota bacterium]